MDVSEYKQFSIHLSPLRTWVGATIPRGRRANREGALDG